MKMADRQSYPRFCRIRHLSQSPETLAVPILQGVNLPLRSRCDGNEPGGPSHPPCFPSNIRPAGPITESAGGLLPHHFTPYPIMGRVSFLLQLLSPADCSTDAPA